MIELKSTVYGLVGAAGLWAHAPAILPATGSGPVSVSESTWLGVHGIDYSTLTLDHKTLTWHWRFSAEPIGAPPKGRVVHFILDTPDGKGQAVSWNGLADYTVDGFTDPTDYNGFLNDFEAGDLWADFNDDGWLDPIDYNTFLNAWEERP